jgi:predicted GNAT superfamily acetyltransferase
MADNRPEPIADRLMPAILALNNAHATELSSFNAEQLQSLIGQAFYARHIDNAGGFLISLDETADYHSPNYLWFRPRYSHFVYIDRVVVTLLMRGRGFARRLYSDLFDYARAAHHRLIVCEINVEPPNPVSDAFHAAMGFDEVGSAPSTMGPKQCGILFARSEAIPGEDHADANRTY